MPSASPPRRPPRLIKADINTLFTRLSKLNPQPATELEYRTPFELLIAVILSAQATDIGVNKATRRLFPVANTPEAILKLGETSLKRHIATIGLYNAKAKNIIATCQQLLDRHAGEVPHDRAALEALPGVGRKTANVVLNTVFGEPVIAVDTHIFRISNRIGLAPGKTVREVEHGLMKAIPAHWQHGAHHWLILHGRYVCKARRPDCPQCVIVDICRFQDKTSPSTPHRRRDLPIMHTEPTPRPARTPRPVFLNAPQAAAPPIPQLRLHNRVVQGAHAPSPH